MRRYIYRIFFLLLMVASLIRASYGQTEEYAPKQAILNERTARFKAETGFEGVIGYNQTMGFAVYRGNFRDIPITAPQDTIAMNQVFKRVLSKLKPYTRAKEGQLEKGAIVSLSANTYLTYRQRVNGYAIENAGELTIDYNIPQKEIIITDNTVDISAGIVQVNISLDRAIQIAIQRYKSSYSFDPDNEFLRPRSKLIYYPIPQKGDSYQFRLCYMITFSEISIFIDPSLGDVIHTQTLIIVD